MRYTGDSPTDVDRAHHATMSALDCTREAAARLEDASRATDQHDVSAECLLTLRSIRTARLALEAAEARTVRALRAADVTWQTIAGYLGVSTQAAQQKHAGNVR